MNEHKVMPSNKASAKNQRKLTDMYQSTLEPNAAKKSKVDENQLQFLLKALLPFETVENVGFHHLWGWLQQYSGLPTQLELPSRGTMAVGALNDVYFCYKNKLIDVLTESGQITISELLTSL